MSKTYGNKPQWPLLRKKISQEATLKWTRWCLMAAGLFLGVNLLWSPNFQVYNLTHSDSSRLSFHCSLQSCLEFNPGALYLVDHHSHTEVLTYQESINISAYLNVDLKADSTQLFELDSNLTLQRFLYKHSNHHEIVSVFELDTLPLVYDQWPAQLQIKVRALKEDLLFNEATQNDLLAIAQDLWLGQTITFKVTLKFDSLKTPETQAHLFESRDKLSQDFYLSNQVKSKEIFGFNLR